MGIFRLLIYALLIYLVFRLVRIIFLPFTYRNNPFGNNRQDSFNRGERKREGETTVKHIPKDKQSQNNNSDDEYVDYEEVD